MNLQILIMAESKMIREVEMKRKRLELYNAFHYNSIYLWKELCYILGKRLNKFGKYFQKDHVIHSHCACSNAKMIVA